MNRLAVFAIAAFCLAACGEKQTIASKSAAAYRDAVARGVPVGSGGHVHGGHEHKENTTGDQTSPGMEMSVMKMSARASTESVAGIGHGTATHGGTAMPEMQGMSGMQHGSRTAMDHSQHRSSSSTNAMPGMQMGTSSQPMSGMAGMSGMDHAKMHHGSSSGANATPGMQIGTLSSSQATSGMAGMPGMQHGGGDAAPVRAAAPATSSAMSRLSPASTLQPDSFDAPSPTAVRDAAKTKGEMP